MLPSACQSKLVKPRNRCRGIAAATTPAERLSAMTWAQRLKRVFGIDIETSAACGGTMRIIACIEDPARYRMGLCCIQSRSASSRA